MNRFCLISFIFLASFTVFGQNNDSELLNRSETDSLYLLAIKKYILEIDSFHNKALHKIPPKTIYLEYQDYLKKLPESIDGFEIKMIGIENRRKVFRKNGNHLRYVKIHPLSIIDGEFHIVVLPYRARLKKGNFMNLILFRWTSIVFEFKNGQLMYKRTENGEVK